MLKVALKLGIGLAPSRSRLGAWEVSGVRHSRNIQQFVQQGASKVTGSTIRVSPLKRQFIGCECRCEEGLMEPMGPPRDCRPPQGQAELDIERRSAFHGSSPRIGPADVRRRIDLPDDPAYSAREKPHIGVSARISTAMSRPLVEAKSQVRGRYNLLDCVCRTPCSRSL
jgi:hypothetical protein